MCASLWTLNIVGTRRVRRLFLLYLRLLHVNLVLKPAVDSISLSLMREFNKDPPSSRWLSHLFSRSPLLAPPPLIYVTFQAYLRRSVYVLLFC